MRETTLFQKALKDLEWRHIITAWQELCGTELGCGRVSSLPFAENRAQAEERRDLVGEIRFLIRTGDAPTFSTLPPLTEITRRLDRGGTIKAESLHHIMVQLSLAKDLKRLIDAEERPNYSRFVAPLEPMNHLYSLLHESVDEQGEIRSSASPELYGLRKRKASLHKELVGVLDGIMDRRNIAPYLQDRFHTQREERFVLPIKSEFRSKVQGIIHGTSGSGQTVFMEPQEVFTLNNRLKEIQSEIEIEEYRILARLGSAVADSTDVIRGNEEILAELDAWNGAARLAEAMDAMPLTWSDGGEVNLQQARHPLLVLEGLAVVANDLALERGKVLVITGPNGGGKTVTVKTAGLTYLMGRMGLFVPCGRNSTMPFFDDVVTMIGDDQDIASHLSTFSAQLTNMRRVIETAGPGTLAVLDELAVGTDPSQGAVLAQAVLERLLREGVTTMVTTHFSRLKALAMIAEGFVNASVGGKSAKPDFKLIPGLPGTSEGIAVAERLGLDARVTMRARELLGEGENRIDNLLAELHQRKRELEALRRSMEEATLEADKETIRLKNLRVAKEKELKRLRKEGYENTMEEVVRVRRLLSHLEAEAKKDAVSPVRRKELTRAIEKVASTVTQKLDQFAGPPLRDEELTVGRRVRSKSLGSVVEILDLGDDGKVLVSLGAFKSWLLKEDLVAAEVEKKSAPSSLKRTSPTKKPPTPAETTEDPETRLENVVLTRTNTLDVRGKRVEQAIAELERHLDQMVMSGETGCAVIHGYGTGALRATVRDHLRDSPFVRLFRPGKRGEGDDGVTVILMV